jgi:hypothetical protein
MILEGIVTTTDPDGRCHAAAMGPHVDEADIDRRHGGLRRLVLKPFGTSSTCGNLTRHGEGVFHLTDDSLLIARLVAGEAETPPHRPASAVAGFVLDDACMAHEFRVVASDASTERAWFEAEVVASHRGRPFQGLNRGTHAVIEAAILVSRLGILDAEEIRNQLRQLAILVEKTGGRREREAFAVLAARVG